MFKQDSQSIQQLLVAEKRAEERINQARKRKTLKLKQAKEDAQAEIENLRAEQGKVFKEFESKFHGTREKSQIQIERDTEKSIIEMEKFVRLNKGAIIDFLLDQVYTIECQVHQNFRQDAC